jgi:hypothetical protein
MHCCWTCGDEQDTKEMVFMHMKDQHEEGIDYIVCPVCGELVVDMIMHFMNSHNGMSIPNGTQLKITGIAKDFRSIKSKEMVKQKKRKYKQGFFTSTKNKKEMHYRSGWELDCYKILENSFAVRDYHVEPFPINYVFAGSSRRYWPDILVNFIDDAPGRPSKALVEVKPLSQCPTKDGRAETLDQAVNDAKWQAANNFCIQRSMDFVVWTERSIVKLSRFRRDALTKASMIGCNDE